MAGSWEMSVMLFCCAVYVGQLPVGIVNRWHVVGMACCMAVMNVAAFAGELW